MPFAVEAYDSFPPEKFVVEVFSELSEETIRHNLEGNICRCTGYYNIVKAVAAGARAMRAGAAT